MGILLGWNIRVISKPLIMLSLIGYYILHPNARQVIFLVALIFALLGDIFLLNNTENAFIFGLLSFLIMQICYAIVFYKQTSLWLKKDSLFALAMLAYITTILYFLWPHTAEFRVPIIVYSLAFGVVAMMAFWRHKSFKGWKMVLFGVLLFVLSDTIIAMNKFLAPISKADFWIMLTYGLGQFLIVEGYIRSKTSKIK